AVVRDPDLASGTGWPDGPDLHCARAVASARAARLRHSPELRQLYADRVEKLDHLDWCWSGTDVHSGELVEPEHGAQLGKDLFVRSSDLLLELLGYGLAALLQAQLLQSGRQRVLDGLALLLRLACKHRLESRLQLLPD